MNNYQNGNNGSLKTKPLETFQIVSPPSLVKAVAPEEEELNIRQLFSVVKHRALLISIITLGVTAAIGVWSFLKSPVYQGKFLLLIGKPIEEDKAKLQVQEILPQLGGEEIDYDTQIQVLSSPQILAPALKTLQRQYQGFDYQDLIKKKGKSPLNINQLKKTKVLEITYEDRDPKKIEKVLKILADSYLRYSAQERKTEINQGLDFVTAQLPLLYEKVNLRQQQMQQFRQKYNFLDPEKAAQRLSEQFAAVEKEYIEAKVALSEANSRYQLLEKQVGLDPDRAIIATYLSESPGYQELLKQFQAVEVELAKQSAIYASDSPMIATLQEMRANLLPLLQKEARKAVGGKLPETEVDRSPSIVSPSDLRVELTKNLIQAANERETLQIKVRSLADALKAQKSQVKNLATLARQYTDLQREVEISTESLNRFLEEQQKLQLKVAQQVVPWKIIAPPEVLDRPVSPKTTRDLALGIVGGLVLGLGAAFLAERLDPVYHSIEEIKEDTKLPILGSIPWQKDLGTIEKVLVSNVPRLKIGERSIDLGSSRSPKNAVVGSYQSSAFSEAFRTLTTNIRLLGADSALKSLVFSSVSPGDGKTTVAVNLAKAAAAMGQRVLLVEADLRRPQVHVRLNLDNDYGLSNVIATGLDWREAIKTLPGYETLSIVTAGEIPPDPTRLLSSRKMQDLMTEWQNDDSFDLVIYDLPPISSFADARILAALTAGIILVAKIGKTDRFAVRNLIEELKLSQITVLGAIANNVSRKNHGYGYYGYYKS
ncbi:polysaccharide biosynthesis tyrosine autokinase [Pannus brasiliensis CCIBt3594]|uniref:Polysaccharide biosynthesis tyrosine autokinase n=1 Tax=Pannus brasiliensis CCIBt3594 TaxID=1427578 RepID=A0AAW9QY78_9CHRO